MPPFYHIGTVFSSSWIRIQYRSGSTTLAANNDNLTGIWDIGSSSVFSKKNQGRSTITITEDDLELYCMCNIFSSKTTILPLQTVFRIRSQGSSGSGLGIRIHGLNNYRYNIILLFSDFYNILWFYLSIDFFWWENLIIMK